MPWYFTYDRVNYACYLLVYWLEVIDLPVPNMECHEIETNTGEWTAQHQGREPFLTTASDQAIEQTINCDSKTKGGLKMKTLQRGAAQQ